MLGKGLSGSRTGRYAVSTYSTCNRTPPTVERVELGLFENSRRPTGGVHGVMVVEEGGKVVLHDGGASLVRPKFEKPPAKHRTRRSDDWTGFMRCILGSKTSMPIGYPECPTQR